MEKISTKDNFFQAHSKCCFCGGEKKATTIEHAPPICLFIDRLRWKGLEFPACTRCNHGSSTQDQVVAFFALAQRSAIHDDEKLFSYAKKLGDGLVNNHKEKWKILEYFDDQTLSFKLNPQTQTAYLDPWAVKMALALWYEHKGEILSKNGRVLISWAFNGEYQAQEFAIEFAKNLTGIESLKQGMQDSEAQFAYSYGFTIEDKAAVFQLILQGSSIVNIVVFSDVSDLPERISTHSKAIIYKTSALNGITRIRL